MAFLFRENRRHGAYGQMGTTFSTAPTPIGCYEPIVRGRHFPGYRVRKRLKTVQVRFRVAQGCWMSFDDNVRDFRLMPRRSNCACGM